MAIRTLIADDQSLVRYGLRKLLDGEEVAIVGEAATADELLAKASALLPELMLVETQLAGIEVVTLLPRLREIAPNAAVLVFSASDTPLDEARVYANGAAGFVSRAATRTVLLEAIRVAVQGGSLWSGTDQRRLGSYLRASRRVVGDFAPLTPREEQILRILTTGATNKKISEELGISHETVKEHVQHVLQKIGVTDRTQAAVWAVRNGIA